MGDKSLSALMQRLTEEPRTGRGALLSDDNGASKGLRVLENAGVWPPTPDNGLYNPAPALVGVHKLPLLYRGSLTTYQISQMEEQYDVQRTLGYYLIKFPVVIVPPVFKEIYEAAVAGKIPLSVMMPVCIACLWHFQTHHDDDLSLHDRLVESLRYLRMFTLQELDELSGLFDDGVSISNFRSAVQKRSAILKGRLINKWMYYPMIPLMSEGNIIREWTQP